MSYFLILRLIKIESLPLHVNKMKSPARLFTFSDVILWVGLESQISGDGGCGSYISETTLKTEIKPWTDARIPRAKEIRGANA